MAGQKQPARGRGVQSGNNVGECDLATGGRRLEGVQVYGPASRERRQSGGDVLKRSREGGLNMSEENVESKGEGNYQSFHAPAAQPGCLVCLGASLSGSASGESPTGEYCPPERPDGGFELESTCWVCGTTGWMGDRIKKQMRDQVKKEKQHTL